MRGLLAFVVLGCLPLGLGAAEPPATPDPSRECEKWSIKGLRLGMTLGEVKRAHPKLKHGTNWFRPDDKGRGWYFWAESRMHGIYNYVLPERDDDAARIVSIVALIDLTDVSATAAVDALVDRWGPPITRDVPIAKARYFSVFGAPAGEFDWKTTSWEDADCGVLVTAFEKTVLTMGLNTPHTTLTLSLDSIAWAEADAARDKQEALEATRP